ncbi:thiamine biosynthesis protein ThiF [candidate division WOR-1 bacterium RIFOXYA12_FULL_43_27]|uniref:Thiamine biosynthesis protein ThiF n=1 Tax=candidate division WOR-1 bacterium RIFOXYC2_FULL_46_14 TaxID=1802587 RepID=A0A1F4U704_UNCSA|nr:MAG: thiamine biosynthesis protein ThiF [candidate division WOR-1 bacterium RIFOXYA12_FULL_43_27]OGC19628.1 MAG: thiamine biosynthesis protein ThiF [candidate division WOR-1 bacterium RIFOXYB2_FULL_46_45]OGC30616.1 MAG: thiamine biosynthesis protein ThiF [candidate division WOR-1 bacterium RIFOXYA2_FULL_46_56]OGC40659.1 MAG: thiamine biosynthesis protein ThiF [candidate division WOR-1 bacterium RIFOXYC2_FULL_46_14]
MDNGIFERNTKGVREKLKGKKIGIAGCGGLGSNLAINLVRMGADNLVLVDFDVIEPSNLNRQQYFQEDIGKAKVETLKNLLLKINPCLAGRQAKSEIRISKQKLNPNNIIEKFKNCEVVAECFDCADQKAMLVNTLLVNGFKVVAVSGLAGDGDPQDIKIKYIRPDFVMIGDERSKCGCGAGLISARVSVAAAYQAWAVYKLCD